MRKLKAFFKNIIPNLVFAAISLLVGILSALLTKGNMNIYDTVTTPKLAPPAGLFPIVWTVLFILMGIGAGEIYKRRESASVASKKAFIYFSLQLFVNFLWSILFFNAMQFLLCVFVLLALILLVVLMIVSFYTVKPLAAFLQLPYIVWLLFALYLNIGIVLMN